MDAATRRLRDAYDQDAARRGELEPDPWRNEIVDRFAGEVRSAGYRRVVELGCGAGQMARRLLDAGLDVTAVDISAAMAARTAARGVNVVVADLGRLPFGAASFGGALAFNSFVHTPRAQLATLFTEVRRVLARDALLTVVVWGGITGEGPLPNEWLDPPRFFSTLSDDDLLAQRMPGFERLDARFLHEQARNDIHPQVLTLRAI